jgi:Family of unknown function (DUF5880)
MSDSIESAAAAEAKRGAESIAAVLKATGPVVKCVLLQHMRDTGRDAKPHTAASELKAEALMAELSTAPSAVSTAPPSPPHKKHREVLAELIHEVEVDTTPGNNGVQKALGGNFTFLGQYPDLGVVLMARADQFADLNAIDRLSVRQLKAVCNDSPDISDTEHMLEKSDLVQAVKDAQLPLNPHKLQPPFDHVSVRGDILLMKVADTPEEENGDDDDPESVMAKAVNDFTSATAVPNEEFFLDYTTEEYIAFASRTDVVAPVYEGASEEETEDQELEEGEDDEGDGLAENDDDEDDEDYTGEDLLDEDEDKRVLLNLILGEVIKSFRKENGRGPDSEELLDLRSQVAAKLGLQLPPPTPVSESKRNAVSNPQHPPSPKRVKFTPDVMTGADGDDDDDDDKKMAATNQVDDKQEAPDATTKRGDDEGDSKPEAT